MRLALLLLCSIVSFSVAGATNDVAIRTYKGPSKSVGNGRAYAWVQIDSTRNPVAIGVTLTRRALSGLSQHAMKSWNLTLPKHAVPFNHVGLDWNPHGHEPDHIYDKPHFDFHFYFITKGKRRHISCTGADLTRCEKAPPMDYQPSDYVQTPGGIPMMGAHWVDPFADEFNGGTFEKTFIWGSYDGRLAFMEPMVTREYFLTQPDFMVYIKDAAKVDRSGYYPTHYAVRYDPTAQTYSVSLVDLRYRAASLE